MNVCQRCGVQPVGLERVCQKCLEKEAALKAAHLLTQPIQEVGAGLIVWPFDQAPKIYQDMSQSGGDEDWVVLIPPNFNNGYTPFWLENLDSGHHPEIYTIAQGYQILIASH